MKHLFIALSMLFSVATIAQTAEINWMTIEEAAAAQKKNPKKINPRIQKINLKKKKIKFSRNIKLWMIFVNL